MQSDLSEEFSSKQQRADEKAALFYRLAADYGDAEAQAKLGWHYESGRGVGQSEAIAVSWYRKAAQQNNAYAQAALRRLGHIW